MTKEELAAWVEAKGGVWHAVIHAGLTVDDLPEDCPAEIEEALCLVQDAVRAAQGFQEWLG